MRRLLLRGAYFALACLLVFLFRPASTASMALPTPPDDYTPGSQMPRAASYAYCDWDGYNYHSQSDEIWCSFGHQPRVNFFSYSRKSNTILRVSIWLEPVVAVGDIMLVLGAPECARTSWGLRELFWPSFRISAWAFDSTFRPESRVYFVSYHVPGWRPEECRAWRGFTTSE